MVSVNLIPEYLVVAQARRRRTRRWLVACVVSIMVVAVPLGLESYRIARAEELGALDDRLGAEQETVESELAKIVVASHEAFLQIERAKALRSKRSWSSVLSLLADTMPASCWLTELATDPPAPTGFQRRTPESQANQTSETATTVLIEAPRKLHLVGFASDTSEPLTFVNNLRASGVFANVVSQGTRREPYADDYFFRFELDCEW